MTRLVTVAHGTRNPAGNRVAAHITAAAAARLATSGTSSYVELCEPLLADVMEQSSGETVVVPLLLSRGYHVAVDLPAAALRSSGSVVLTPPLGPHPLLAQALAARLVEAGAQVGQPVVLVSAGSRDPRGAADLEEAAAVLADLWGGPVRTAAFAGPLPRPGAVVRPDDAVAPYLLAPGHFADRCRDEARAARAGVVADVIGAHEAVVDLVVERVRSAVQDLGQSTSTTSTRSPAWTSAAPSGSTA